MALTFATVKVDWNRDNDFSDSGENISADVMSFTWERSIDPGKHFANNDRASIIVGNDDAKYSPENTGSSLYPNLAKQNRVVQIEIQGVRVFTGLIEDIKPAPFKAGRRTARITCTGLKRLLDVGDYFPPVFQNMRVDEIASLLIQGLPVPIPGNSTSGVVGKLVIGTDTVGSVADLAVLQKGHVSFPYAGDFLHGPKADDSDRFFYEPGTPQNIKKTTRWEFLKDLIEAEGGLLYFGGDGKLNVRYRYWLVADQITNSYTLTDDFQEAEYQTPHGNPSFFNRVDIKYRPVTEAAVKTTVWTNKEAYTVPAAVYSTDAILEVEIIFDEETSATKLKVQTATASSNEGNELPFELLKSSAQKARFRLVNSQTTAQTIPAGELVIQGNALSINSGIATLRDSDSIEDVGEKPLAKTLRAISTHHEAIDLADLALLQHSDNSARFASIGLEALNPDSSDRILNMDIGTRINVVESHTSHNSEYHVFGQHGRYSAEGSTELRIDFTLQKASHTQVARYGKENQNADVSLRETGGADKLAQSFQISRAASISKVRLLLRAVGNPAGTMTLTIETDSSGDPSGTPITNGTANTVDENNTDVMSGGYQWIEFTFATAPSLSASTTYWLVLSTNRLAHASNYIEWGADDQRQDIHDDLVDAWTFDASAITAAGIGASWSGNNDLTPSNTPVSQLAWAAAPDLRKPYDTQGINARMLELTRASSQSLDITDAAQTGLDITGPMTVCLWAKPKQVGIDQIMVSKWDTAPGNDRTFQLWVNSANDYVRFDVSSDGSTSSAITASTFGALEAGQRYFIAARYDGTNIQLRVNDTDQTPVAFSAGLYNGAAGFSVGANQSGGANYLDAFVKPVLIFDDDLTTTQLDFIYNSGAGRQRHEILGYTSGQMKSEASSVWSAEVKDACFEIHMEV